jgi:serine/threonine-protein kinase RsbW/stage II sporulation protein AB (anti-sigma F factor)
MASVAGMGPEEADSFCAFGRTVPARPENLGPLRHAIVELATRAGADEDVRTDLALAFAEACANVVVHAYGPGEVGFLDVRAEVGGEEITVAVTDHGRGMTPRPDSPGLGLGLPLIANLSDTLQIRDGPGGVGTELVMAFGLKRARA